MRKIPTLYQRNPENLRELLPEVHPDCEWVLAGEGIPTRKYDGTCVMFDGMSWWARREVRADAKPPAGWVQEDHDPATGKSVGWEPIGQFSFAKAFRTTDHEGLLAGTYELCGPKVNGNPEHFPIHTLVRHATAEVVKDPDDLSLDGLRAWFQGPEWPGYEGIVWHHPDGRMAKIKKRDFPR